MEAAELNAPCIATTIEESSYNYFLIKKQGSDRGWQSYSPTSSLVLPTGARIYFVQNFLMCNRARTKIVYSTSSSLDREYISAEVAQILNSPQTRFQVPLSTVFDESDDADIELMSFVAKAKPGKRFIIKAKIKFVKNRIPKVSFDEDLF